MPWSAAVLGQLVNQVADVVQQGRHDQLVARARLLGVIGGLQRVLQLRDRLADVGGVSLGGEQFANLVDDVHGRAASRRCVACERNTAAPTLVSRATPARA